MLIGTARPAGNYRGLMEDATPAGRAWDRIAAAPDPKPWKVYDGGHAPTPGAAKYMREWLLENL